MSKTVSTADHSATKKWIEPLIVSLVYHICLLAIVIAAVECA